MRPCGAAWGASMWGSGGKNTSEQAENMAREDVNYPKVTHVTGIIYSRGTAKIMSHPYDN